MGFLLYGTVAEWLGRALQKLIHWFDSSRCLKKKNDMEDKIILTGEFKSSKDRFRPKTNEINTNLNWGRFLNKLLSTKKVKKRKL
jgi:hypothetical protein